MPTTTQDQARKPSRDEISAALTILKGIADTIRDLGSVPSGQLYAALMGRMDLDKYERVVSILKNAGLVTEEAHVLTWTGGAA